ncbi:Murein L,D-transpeptidase YcbB/YkuD [Sphingomonas sp. OV641]|uniref:L,D-transpeptidase family protein n=1 Tax=Sphingomonas sp. OV641 TaxID=1881068 RepID=UPI0008AD2B09|nr:L,D-transpeptidase family protein [Sphingomonas sp. OV641]SEJ23908.1 Murein L,D-transpeptidase YcbB/YkuD [Sphingomonas sp. OV641]
MLAGRGAPARRAGRLALSLILLASTAALPGVAAAQEDVEKTAEGNAVAQEIRQQVGGKLKEFYRARGYWPLWIVGEAPGPQARALVDVIETVEVDGLDPDRYSPDRLRRYIEAAEGGDLRALAHLELALSGALADLVRDMRETRIEISYLEDSLEPTRAKPDAILRRAALAKSTLDYVRNLGWMSPLYTQLREALLSADPDMGDANVRVPGGPLLKPGMTGERVLLLRARLGLPDGDQYDDALRARVRRFQSAHGLPVDGIAGARTITALNGGSGRRIVDRRDILRLNLERARLLPDAWTRHIVVDAAAARLWYYDSGAEQGTMRVVAGTPETQTPMMAGMVRYATLNPYWNVPVDLVRKRIAPKVLAGVSLERQGYEALSDWTAEARVIPASTIDWRGVEAGTVEPRVRELPGRGNSMGSVKFMFPNDLGIYLHDTPQKKLFSKPDRHFSNGCVRLEDAGRLGEWLFNQPLKPDSSAPEQHVPVPEPVPVYLMYFTASPDGGGVKYVSDVYGRDRPALQHLASR